MLIGVTQLDLSTLIKTLKNEDPNKILKIGFNNPHSYRGYYEQLAFEPAENISVREMLKCAKNAQGCEFSGYKGGIYKMFGHTPVWIAHYGSTGETLGVLLLNLLLSNKIN